MDGNAGGYVIKFLQDQQSSWYASLYLDRMGQHRGFFPELNPHARADDDEDEASLKAISFENFLYDTWMDELCWFTLARGELRQAQIPYLVYM